LILRAVREEDTALKGAVVGTMTNGRPAVQGPGQSENGNRVPVFRLHGGVDWELREGKIQSADDPLKLLRSKDTRIAIATPGRRKAQFAEVNLEPSGSKPKPTCRRRTRSFSSATDSPKRIRWLFGEFWMP